MIRFYKHVKTCHKYLRCDLIQSHHFLSKRQKESFLGDKVIPWIASSKSSDQKLCSILSLLTLEILPPAVGCPGLAERFKNWLGHSYMVGIVCPLDWNRVKVGAKICLGQIPTVNSCSAGPAAEGWCLVQDRQSCQGRRIDAS